MAMPSKSWETSITTSIGSPEATAALEKAAGLLNKDAWVHAELASAYFHMKEVDKAKRAVDRVMELTPDLAVRTKIAWELAQAGVDLDRAAELAHAAENEIAAATERLELKYVDASHLDLVERLAWLWDTLGWVHFQKGNLVEAERYVHAAWQIAGKPDVAFHLGRIYEKRSRLADALSFYLTAQALASTPTPEMIAHVKRLSGGGDLKVMLQSAKELAPSDRIFRITEKSGAGEAEFLALVGKDRQPMEVRFSSGSESLRAFGETGMKGVRCPVEFPADSPARLAVGLRIRCDRAGRLSRGGCVPVCGEDREVTECRRRVALAARAYVSNRQRRRGGGWRGFRRLWYGYSSTRSAGRRRSRRVLSPVASRQRRRRACATIKRSNGSRVHDSSAARPNQSSTGGSSTVHRSSPATSGTPRPERRSRPASTRNCNSRRVAGEIARRVALRSSGRARRWR